MRVVVQQRPQVARRTAILLLAAATIALLFGGVCLLMAVALPRMGDNVEIQNMLTDMRQQTSGVEPSTLFFTGGTLFVAYALAGLTLGVGLFRGTRPWISAAIVFCSIVGSLMALNALVNIAQGTVGGMLGALVLTAPHALGLWWLLHAAVAPTTPLVLAPPPAYRPMQDYYLPPVAPATGPYGNA